MIETTLGGQGERTKDGLLEQLKQLLSSRPWTGELSRGETTTPDGRRKRNGTATLTISNGGAVNIDAACCLTHNGVNHDNVARFP